MGSNKFLDAAIEYLGLGLSVVILGKESKEPVTVHTPNGLKDATHDPDVARGWWELTPKCNVGAVLGAASGGIVVIDIDRKHGVDGYETMRDWEMEHGDMPETATCCTPTGGYHLYYRADREIRPSTNDRLGVDIRGDDSYVVMPPSVHPDTKTEYTWEFPPDEVGIADADELVYEFIEYVRPASEGDGGGAAPFDMPDEVREGMRDVTMYKFACSERAHDRPMGVTIAAALEYNKTCFKPPLPESEVRKKVESAYKHAPGFSDEVRGKLAESNGGAETVPKVSKHVEVANVLLDKYSACYLDGAPAVFNGLTYRIGWTPVERAVLREWRNAKDRERKEVVKYLDLVMPREKQSPPNFIGFENGVLDVNTMDLMSFSPDFRIPNVIPHDWNPDARSDVLDATLSKIACGDPYIEANLCEFIGLCMYRSGKYAFAAILLGRKTEKASNGKSTYINLLKNVLGKDNFSALSLCDFGEKFNRQYLSGKLANLGDDISSEFTKGASLEVFKKAVSGDTIHTDVKNGKGYDFEPYCTVVLSANEFPKMENLDDGVLRRLFPIRFNAHFSADDPDFNPEIKDLFKESEEIAEAAIVRGIWGLRRVMEQRRPTDNAESRSMVRDIQTDNSSILQWIDDEQRTRDEFEETMVGAVYEWYEKWCARSGVRNSFAKWQFSKKVCEHFKFKVKNTSRNGASVRIFVDA